MTTDYLQRIIDDPKTSREEYMWAWDIMQNRIQAQHQANVLADKLSAKPTK